MKAVLRRYIAGLIIASVVLLQSGCVMLKIGGIKSTESKEISREPHDARIISFSTIKPKLTADGHLSLCLTGELEEVISVKQRVIDYGDEWKAIGFFPGYDSHVHGYWKKNDQNNPFLFPISAILCNCIMFGLPTLSSILGVIDQTPTKLYEGPNDVGLSSFGVLGAYVYEGTKYKKGERIETIERVSNTYMSTVVKGYMVLVDNAVVSDRDGVVTVGRDVQKGEVIRFKIVSCPKHPSCPSEMLEPFLNREFMAVCE